MTFPADSWTNYQYHKSNFLGWGNLKKMAVSVVETRLYQASSPVSQLWHQLTECLFPLEQHKWNTHTHTVIIISSAWLLISSAHLFICHKTHDMFPVSQSVVKWQHCSEALKVCWGLNVLQNCCREVWALEGILSVYTEYMGFDGRQLMLYVVTE